MKFVFALLFLYSSILRANSLNFACLPIESSVASQTMDVAYEKFVWNFETANQTRFSTSEFGEFTRFLAMIRNHFQGDLPHAHNIISNQRDIFIERGGANQGRMHDLVLDGALGEVRKVNCLEAYLYQRHLSYRVLEPMYIYSEYAAIVLKKQDKLIVYFASSLMAIGMAPSLDYWMEEVLSKINNEGYQYLANIHNHPFKLQPRFFEPGGSIVPSGCLEQETCLKLYDIGLLYRNYRNYNLINGIITNGIDSLVIPVNTLQNLPDSF